MYENQTPEVITDRKKAWVKENYPEIDTREGSMVHIALAASSIESSEVYSFLNAILKDGFADTASRTFLKLRAAERGLTPSEATMAILRGVFTPSELSLAVGERFTLSGLNYKVIEKISDGVYKLECETAGAIGNVYFGDLVPIGNVVGLQTAKLTDVIIPGEDEQDTDDFRQEYFDGFETNDFGGNIYDYQKKVNDLPGVGGLKVYPVWDGAKTVKIVFIDSNFGKPSTELVALTQNAIDPVGHQGEGIGIAPIWHIVTVEGVQEIAINIVTTITYQAGWDYLSTKSYIEAAIDAYLLELRKVWEDTIDYLAGNDTGLIVRVSQIETRLLDLAGILDIENTSINGVAGNLVIATNQIPIRGTFNGS